MRGITLRQRLTSESIIPGQAAQRRVQSAANPILSITDAQLDHISSQAAK
jgi:hypothetical protein